MKIVHIITRSDLIGGAHVHVRDLSLGLQQRGHQVLVAAGGSGPFAATLAEEGIPYRALQHLVRPIRPWKDWQAYQEIKKLLREVKPDLVTVHSSKAGWLGRAAARRAGFPVIFTAHGWLFTEGAGAVAALVYRWAERLAAPLGDRIITVSEYGKNLAVKYRVARPEKLAAVHNGLPDISGQLRASPGVQPPRLVMVARFEKPKDHLSLISALDKLKDRSWRLDLVGDGPLRPAVEEQVGRCDLAERVFFLGTRDDVADILSGAQLFILLSSWEGFPLSVLEAMRAGLPVVASAVGGVGEALLDGETGYLIEPSNGEQLVNRLARLIDEPALREQMGRAGRRRFEEQFTFNTMMEKTLLVYNTVLADRKCIHKKETKR